MKNLFLIVIGALSYLSVNAQTDTIPPTVVCKQQIASILPTGLISLWASEFLEAASDNETPADQLIFAIRKAGTGNGFPRDAQGNPITAVTFDCDEQGVNQVELWTEDLAGNADYCLAEATVTDPNAFCSEDSFINLLFCITRPCDDESVEEIDYELLGNPPSGSPNHINFLDSMGCFYYNGFIPLGSIISITPTKNDDPLNGVTIYDLVLIYAHILGLQPLPSPYDMIAADANKSGSITTFDIIELQKLIIGTYTELPNNTSWRFIDSDFVFPSSNNPFQTAFPETKSIVDIWAGADSSITFYGIKVGDVNCSAIPNPDFVPQPLPEKVATIRGKQKLTPGTVTSIQLSLNEANQWMGAQLALAFDPDVLRPVGQPGSSLPLNDFAFAVSDDVVKMAGLFNTFQLLPAGSPILTVNFEVLQAADLEEAVWLDTIELSSEVYDLDLEQFSLAANYKYAINQDDPVSPPIKKTPLLDPPVAYVYPNPSQGKIQLMTEVEGYLQIRNAQGYLMSTQRVSKGSNELYSGSWLPGMYSWQLVNGDQVLSGTLIRR
jgi:hypothetical protein